MSALRLINETEITSSVSSVNITDVFSADFDIYKITTSEIGTVGTTATQLYARYINSSGSVISASNYDIAYLNLKSNLAFGESRFTNQTSLFFQFGTIDQDPQSNGAVAYIFNPYSSSSYTFSLSQSSAIDTNYLGTKHIGVLKQTASMTGIQIFEANGSRPFNSGFIRTYGLRVDS